jgi:phosphomannomutase
MLRRRDQTMACVGGDFRRTTPALMQAVVEGLLAAGISVGDMGQAATPVVYFAGRHLGCPNVVVVTASHNPAPYNGIKFLLAGRPATPELMAELQAGLDASVECATPGSVRRHAIMPEYERWVLQQAEALVPVPRARGAGNGLPDRRRQATALESHATAGLRIVVDAMGGAMAELAPRVLAQAGHRVVTLRERIDPDYAAGVPDPSRDANLASLIDRVAATGADLGFALDGDADRVIFVDSGGRIVRPEQIGAVLATHCFVRPTLVYDLKCASLLARAVEAAGGRSLMRPSGHGFIKATIIDEQADLGVEVSGHHFYGVLGGGDDGLLTALVVCRVMVASGESLHQLVAEFPWPAITPDLRIPFSGDSHAVLEAIAGGCGGEVTRLDGVRAQYGGGWALARASITEPAVTLRFEGRDWQRVQEIADRFLAAVPELRAAIPAAALGSPTAAVSSSSLSSAPTNDRGKPTV